MKKLINRNEENTSVEKIEKKNPKLIRQFN